MKRFLLVSLMPPCVENPGGAMLAALCRALPRGSVSCFVAGPRRLHYRVPPDLRWMEIEYHDVVVEPAVRPLGGRSGNAIAWAVDSARFGWLGHALSREAAAMARRCRADALWLYPTWELTVHFAATLRRRSSLPAHTLLTDLLNWAISVSARERRIAAGLMDDWQDLIASSERIAANSAPMVDDFRARGADPVLIYAGFEERYALAPATALHPHDRLVIGFCGNRYVDDSWSALLNALDEVGWRIAGRDVWIRLFGNQFHIDRRRPTQIEFLGWQPEAALLRALHDCDLTYCPHFFMPELAPEARLMLPSKAAIYLASGRPVIYHGPPDTALGRFFVERKAALASNSIEPEEIVGTLTRLVDEPETYARLAQDGRRAFDENLTARAMRSQIPAFLGVPPAELRREAEIEADLVLLDGPASPHQRGTERVAPPALHAVAR